MKIGGWCSSFVGISLIMFLSVGDVFFEKFVKVIEVYSEVSSRRRSKIPFGIERKIGMVAFIGEEWRDTGSFTWGVVVCEFGER